MKQTEFANLIRKSPCRVIGAEDAANDAQREVLAALIRGHCDAHTTILCEPSLARKTTRPPDAVLVDLIAGIHIIEVKGIALDQIEGMEPGGQFLIRYNVRTQGKNPFAQARNAMFDIKDSVERSCPVELVLPFKYWVALATISREEWIEKWGPDAFCPPELLFRDDLPTLAQRLQSSGQNALDKNGLKCWPTDQIQCVWRAFGDSSVLYPRPEERPPRRVQEGLLGDLFDDTAETYKTLSDEQQMLSAQLWQTGPRLVRGVAGSGKTIVLVNNLARRVQRSMSHESDLFSQQSGEPPQVKPKIAVVCFNRTLVPFIQKKIDIAYRQRTGQPLPKGVVEVWSCNRLMWHLSRHGLWRYQALDQGDDVSRASQYLRELQFVKKNDPSAWERCAYDAIYVDEGQDFLEQEFQLFKELCRSDANGEPSLFVFYDDAQNLYGRKRPNWHSLGLQIVGRSHVMSECFRNTRQIVEPTFNVLYGTFAAEKSEVPSKAFGDIGTLEEKQLLHHVDGIWRVLFAKRDGLVPTLTVAQGRQKQATAMIERLRWLTEEQQVRPEDIHLLVYYKNQIEPLVATIENARIPAIEGVHIATTNKDQLLNKRGWLTVSTVASAKGYDAYCVLLPFCNEFPISVQGRASFYVACTRAIEYLELFATSRTGLAAEMEQAIAALQ